MFAFVLVLLAIWVVLAVIGFVGHALIWLAVVALIGFVLTLMAAAFRGGMNRNRVSQ